MCLTEMVQAKLAKASFCLPDQYILYCYTPDLCICMVVSFHANMYVLQNEM